MLIHGRERKFYCPGRLIWWFIRLPKLDPEGHIALPTNTKPTFSLSGRNFPHIWPALRFVQVGCLISFLVYMPVFLRSAADRTLWKSYTPFWYLWATWSTKLILSGILAGYALISGAWSLHGIVHGGKSAKWAGRVAPLIVLFEIAGVVVTARTVVHFERDMWMRKRDPSDSSDGYSYLYPPTIWDEKPLFPITIASLVLWSITLCIALIVALTQIVPVISDLVHQRMLGVAAQVAQDSDETRRLHMTTDISERLGRIEKALGIGAAPLDHGAPAGCCRDCGPHYDVAQSENDDAQATKDPLVLV